MEPIASRIPELISRENCVQSSDDLPIFNRPNWRNCCQSIKIAISFSDYRADKQVRLTINLPNADLSKDGKVIMATKWRGGNFVGRRRKQTADESQLNRHTKHDCAGATSRFQTMNFRELIPAVLMPTFCPDCPPLPIISQHSICSHMF